MLNKFYNPLCPILVDVADFDTSIKYFTQYGNRDKYFLFHAHLPFRRSGVSWIVPITRIRLLSEGT